MIIAPQLKLKPPIAFPSFLGLTGFLERIKFAADPNTDTFYFGPL